MACSLEAVENEQGHGGRDIGPGLQGAFQKPGLDGFSGLGQGDALHRLRGMSDQPGEEGLMDLVDIPAADGGDGAKGEVRHVTPPPASAAVWTLAAGCNRRRRTWTCSPPPCRIWPKRLPE